MTNLQWALLVQLIRLGDVGIWPDGRELTGRETSWLADVVVRAFAGLGRPPSVRWAGGEQHVHQVGGVVVWQGAKEDCGLCLA